MMAGLLFYRGDGEEGGDGRAGVKPALGLGSAAPAAGARVLARADGARAGPAADAGVAPLVQRVRGHVVLAQVGPHVLARPGEQGIHLHEAEARVALHDAGRGAVVRLVRANRADPGLVSAEGLGQRLDLADLAAAAGLALPQRLAVEGGLLREVERGAHRPDPQGVALLEPPPQRVGLGEQEAGVEGEDVNVQPLAGDEVEEHEALGAEARGEGQAGRVARGGPAEDVAGSRALEAPARLDRVRLRYSPRSTSSVPPPVHESRGRGPPERTAEETERPGAFASGPLNRLRVRFLGASRGGARTRSDESPGRCPGPGYNNTSIASNSRKHPNRTSAPRQALNSALNSADLGVLPCFRMTFWCGTGPRIVALLLAAVVCADMTLDAACDPIAFPGPPAAAAVSPDETGGADACADLCVPDCFCCSRSEAAGQELVLPALTALAQVPCAAPRVGACRRPSRPATSPARPLLSLPSR